MTRTKPLAAKLLTAALLLLLFCSAAAAADTMEINPSLTLTFENVPQGLLTGSEISIDTAGTITSDLKTILKSTTAAEITNAAYTVALTPKGFSRDEILKAVIRLPSSTEWSGAHKNICAAAVTGSRIELLPVTLIGTGGDGNIIFETTTRGLPDQILLIATKNAVDFTAQQTTTPTPEKTSAPATAVPTAEVTQAPTLTQAPAPAAGLLLGILCAAIIAARRKQS